MIQMLTLSGKEKNFKGQNVIINSIHEPESLDCFEINIINLQNSKIWCHNGNIQSINEKLDFISLSRMIENSHKTSIVILYPCNYKFNFSSHNGRVLHERELKNMLETMKNHIFKEMFWVLSDVDLIYEKTITKISDTDFSADFFIKDIEKENVLTTSDISEKVTTAYVGDIVLSTLLLKDYEGLKQFLDFLNIKNEKLTYPAWINNIKFFNDIELENVIHEKEQVIIQQKNEIDIAKKSLNLNRKYKSILFINEKELVKVVFEILELMLGWDLSGFIDKYREDFRTETDDVVFIGEIKGVTTNVKNEHITQLETHIQDYRDSVTDDRKIVALLIINHQRKKPLKERVEVNEQQISLATRNEILIIETLSLLKMFDQYLLKKMNREECLEMLIGAKGILKFD